eukprot:1144442-Pelagomonas_calceolata.AAC.3
MDWTSPLHARVEWAVCERSSPSVLGLTNASSCVKSKEKVYASQKAACIKKGFEPGGKGVGIRAEHEFNKEHVTNARQTATLAVKAIKGKATEPYDYLPFFYRWALLAFARLAYLQAETWHSFVKVRHQRMKWLSANSPCFLTAEALACSPFRTLFSKTSFKEHSA